MRPPPARRAGAMDEAALLACLRQKLAERDAREVAPFREVFAAHAAAHAAARDLARRNAALDGCAARGCGCSSARGRPGAGCSVACKVACAVLRMRADARVAAARSELAVLRREHEARVGTAAARARALSR